MFFEDDKVYCSCNNPKGFISLPVGEIWVETPEWESCMIMCDVVYGRDLNELIEKYDTTRIVFRCPDFEKELWRAY